MALLKKLNDDVLTRWRQAHVMLVDSEEWAADDDLHNLPYLDILLAFEDYSRVRERVFEDQMRREQVEKRRRERKAGNGFKVGILSTLFLEFVYNMYPHIELLRELVESGTIKAWSKWKDVYPLFRDDERYLNLLGKPGSNPIELFWDAVEVLDQALDKKVDIVEDGIKRHNVEHAPAVQNDKDGEGSGGRK